VSNTGNRNASNCAVQIDLPETNTSPEVHVMGNLGAIGATCSRSGTTLSCSLGRIKKNKSKSVTFDIALPVSSAPLLVTATASTSSGENSTSNNAATLAASQSYYATAIITAPGSPATILNSHCTGQGLTAWFECTLSPGSVTSHSTEFHDDGSVTIPGAPLYTGQWSVTSTASGSFLEFFYDDGAGVVAEFEGWGADNTCFEGLTTFPGSSWVAPYEVCPQ
jgi:hypothetical protein